MRLSTTKESRGHDLLADQAVERSVAEIGLPIVGTTADFHAPPAAAKDSFSKVENIL